MASPHILKENSMKQKIICVVGARPNFMKSAPLMKELRKYGDEIDVILAHTGQHYDQKLSQLFFDDLKMPPPDIYLGVGSASHGEQTARIMIELEKVFFREKPDLVVVFGDVNSTMASAIVAAKMCIKVAHVESGLRSFDRTMPEEINRIVADHLSDFLFVTEKSGIENLTHEGISNDKIFFTGNIMIDSLVNNLEIARKSDILEKLSLHSRQYVAITLHRPSNVDNRDSLTGLFDIIRGIAAKIPVVFPCHPRTRNNIINFGLSEILENKTIKIIEPLGYLDFLRLQSESAFVLTDSGGVQEETTFLRIPCITVRETTERPVTAEIGSNIVTGTDQAKIIDAVEQIQSGHFKKGSIPDLWDGHTAERIVQIIRNRNNG